MEEPEKAEAGEHHEVEMAPDESNSDPAVEALDNDEANIANRRIAYGTNMSYGRRNGRITYEFNGQWDNYNRLCVAGRGWLYHDQWNHSGTGLVCRSFPSAPAVLRFDPR